MKSIGSSVLFIFAFCILPFAFSNAQVPISIGGLELSASTNNPIPGQKVTITARSYAIDINASKVSWTVNGVMSQNALGATTLEINAPALGKSTTINVSATTPEGRVVSASITVNSGVVDMIVETDGYVPPFFKGKIPVSYQNAIKVIAVPHIANSGGVEYDPKTLVYQWKRNDKALEEQSGYGKQSVTLFGDIVPRPFDVTVTVWPADSSARAVGTVGITFANPSIGFFLNDQLYGPILNKALDSVVRIGSEKETRVLAVPFGFNKPIGSNGPLSLSWLINGIKHAELSSSESVVLRAPGDTAGTSEIQLDIRNTDKILQGSSGSFRAVFSADKKQGEPVEF